MSGPRHDSDVEVVVISGLSGAGRSEAANALEDLGWFVIDNLPPTLIEKMLPLALAPGNNLRRIALVIDARGGVFFEEAIREIDKLRREANCRLVFLEASDDALVRRFDATKRRHPLARQDRVIDGIQRERELMNRLRDEADLILDTSRMSVHDIRGKMRTYFGYETQRQTMTVSVVSFGYKFGLPLDADMVFDVRFLPNPHWVPGLRELDGRDQEVRDYLVEKEGTTEFLDRMRDLFKVLIPGFQSEGRHYLTVAIGCTGGRHRSVLLAEEVGALIRETGLDVKVLHRDVDRAPVAP